MVDESELYDIARALYKNIDGDLTKENSNEILHLLNDALAKTQPDQKWLKAKIHWLAGVINEKLGNIEIALSRYRIAMYFDPKIGQKPDEKV